MGRRIVLCLIVGSMSFPGIGLAQDKTTDGTKKPFDQRALVEKVRGVVKKYFPKAKFEVVDGVIRFDYKTRVFKIHIANLDGEWQNAIDERGPQPGGVYGEIELLDGLYGGMAALPQEFDLHYYRAYVMGDYSRRLDCTSDARVRYPPGEAKEFVKELAEIVAHFEKYVRRKGK